MWPMDPLGDPLQADQKLGHCDLVQGLYGSKYIFTMVKDRNKEHLDKLTQLESQGIWVACTHLQGTLYMEQQELGHCDPFYGCYG